MTAILPNQRIAKIKCSTPSLMQFLKQIFIVLDNRATINTAYFGPENRIKEFFVTLENRYSHDPFA